jgi:DNA-directed RNA polymerase specialized sigma24 family protein
MSPADALRPAAVPAERAEGDRPPALDEGSFRLLYEATAVRLRSYLLRLGGDASLADDVLQETYYRYLAHPPATSDPSARRAFLYRVATNLVYDHFRRRRREARLPAVGPPSQSGPTTGCGRTSAPPWPR